MKRTRLKQKMNKVHFHALVRRYFELILSDRVSLILTILQMPLMLIVISIATSKNIDSSSYNMHVTVFVMVAICAVMGTLNSYREVCKERQILQREYNGGLDVTAYIMSKFAVGAILCFVHALIFLFGTFIIIDFPKGANLFLTVPSFFFVIYIVLLASFSAGLLVSCLLKNSESAVLPILVIIIGQMVLSNTIIKLPDNLFMDIITTPIVTKWGVIALGNIFDIYGLFPEASIAYPIYDINPFIAIAVLMTIIIACTAGSIFKINSMFK